MCRGALSHNRSQAATSAASQPWLWCLLASASCHAWQHPAKVRGWANQVGPGPGVHPVWSRGKAQAWPRQGGSARSWAQQPGTPPLQGLPCTGLGFTPCSALAPAWGRWCPGSLGLWWSPLFSSTLSLISPPHPPPRKAPGSWHPARCRVAGTRGSRSRWSVGDVASPPYPQGQALWHRGQGAAGVCAAVATSPGPQALCWCL